MKQPWYCYGNKKHNIYHPLTENYSSQCSLASCPTKRPLVHRVKPWLPWFASISATAAVIVTILASLPKPSPVLFLHIIDRSASAVNDDSFKDGFEETCGALSDLSKRQFDSTFSILVDYGIEIPHDPRLIESKRLFNQDCKNRLQRRPIHEEGTKVCPAWARAKQEIDKLSGVKPIVITQISANEQEQFCLEDLNNLSETIVSKGGFHIIIGSTNDGVGNPKQGFNEKLRSYREYSTEVKARTKFLESSNPQSCIKIIIDFVRYDKEGSPQC